MEIIVMTAEAFLPHDKARPLEQMPSYRHDMEERQRRLDAGEHLISPDENPEVHQAAIDELQIYYQWQQNRGE